MLNNFFSNDITNLNLPRYIDTLTNTENVKDPFSKAEMKLASHPGIKTIRD